MYVEIGRNTLDPENLPGPDVLERLQALLATKHGYRGYLAVDIGENQRAFVRLWDSEADAKAASEDDEIRQFSAENISPSVTQREVIGNGPALHHDLSRAGAA